MILKIKTGVVKAKAKKEEAASNLMNHFDTCHFNACHFDTFISITEKIKCFLLVFKYWKSEIIIEIIFGIQILSFIKGFFATF
ncbi:hypothetical protein BpHYR1_042382 [Brachionus plicatilis]|uniref:Uncharacterized protein n=1 Tax=Brachionus plicatilis TaxID=10195 RepID=A0A3M7QDU6_BRAPC|nr:hypothetical protein BpHYR1_042382 [Brachionus plicatilis]